MLWVWHRYFEPVCACVYAHTHILSHSALSLTHTCSYSLIHTCMHVCMHIQTFKIGMALWAINTQGESVWVIACIKQLSRRLFTIKSPALPYAKAIYQHQHSTAEWKECERSCMSIHLLVYLEESNRYTLETLASSPGSRSFLKYTTECFKGATKCIFCQSKPSIITVGGGPSRIAVTNPWCTTDKLKVSINYFLISGLVYMYTV